MEQNFAVIFISEAYYWFAFRFKETCSLKRDIERGDLLVKMTYSDVKGGQQGLFCDGDSMSGLLPVTSPLVRCAGKQL